MGLVRSTGWDHQWRQHVTGVGVWRCYLDSRSYSCVCVLGPRRFTNVFDESKLNRIRIFAMFWTYSRIPNTRRTTDPRKTSLSDNPFVVIAFAIALTFIMLFVFNLIIRPSLFIRFSSPLQCHFECFSERVQLINASFNRRMSPLTPPRSVIRQVMGHVDSFWFTCRRYEGESVNVCVSCPPWSRWAARDK